MLGAAVSAFGAAFAASRAGAATEVPASGKLKVVYHLSDLDKVNFVAGNIQNPKTSASRWWSTGRRCGRFIPRPPIPI